MTVKHFITRKSLIYKTDVEYGDYTVNHLQGCAHGCKYPCYAYLMAKRFGRISTYQEWVQPYIVSNTLELLDKEIPKFKDKITSMHLCFTTDPFMYKHQDIEKLSLDVIRKFNDNDINCTVLTKGILPAELADLPGKNEYGITLISLNENFRKKIEPGAAPYMDRISALKYLHDKGHKTWVSIEPYPTPNIIEQDLSTLLKAIGFADKIIFGRMNYNRKVTEFKEHRAFFNKMADMVIKFCKKQNINFYIKKGTVKPILSNSVV
jgi:DNA repair photolyase